MEKEIWIVKTLETDRPMVTAIHFGLYTVFPSQEAAEAFSHSPLCSQPNEVVKGLLSS